MTDLFYSEKLYDPSCSAAAFFTAVGETPALIVASLAAASLFTLLPKCRLPEEIKRRILRFALYAAATLMLSAAAVFALKHFWGRIRYADLKTPDDFTPWYVPGTKGAGSSFPSGHAAMASLALLGYDFLKYFGLRGRAAALILGSAFVAAVSVSRVILGAHYVSDVLAGIAITLIIKQISGYFILKKGSLNSKYSPHSQEACPAK